MAFPIKPKKAKIIEAIQQPPKSTPSNVTESAEPKETKPSFMPKKQEPLAKIETDAKGNVRYSVGNKATDLTPEEYKEFVGVQKGNQTENEKLRELQFREQQERDIRTAVEGKRKESYDAFVKAEAVKRLLEQGATQQEAEAKVQKTTIENGKVVSEVGGLPDVQGLELGARQETTIKGGVEQLFKGLDSMRKLATGGDTVDVTKARGTIKDQFSAITALTEEVKLGLSDPTEASLNFALAEQALNRLETRTKKVGIDNLNYWLRDGKDLEAEIIIYKREMEKLKQNLDIATIQAQSNTQLNNALAG